MISYTQAREMISAVAQKYPISSEEVSLEKSLSRVLAQDVFSPEDIPSFHNSAMDGFALCASETQTASLEHPVIFQVRATAAAGDEPLSDAPAVRSTVEIMTGAPLPAQSYDAVIKLEDIEWVPTRKEGPQKTRAIAIKRPVKRGENIRHVGTDFRKGQKVASRGDTILPEHIMAFASLGVDVLSVKRRPHVAVISTGRELTSYNEKNLKPGQIRNSTGPYLQALLAQQTVSLRYYGIVEDDPQTFVAVVQRALDEGADVILSTGAVSMGKYDFVGAALETLGAQVLFHKCAIRPGKPILCAELSQGAVFFGLPGNPMATAVGHRFFVEPYLQALLGLPAEIPQRISLKNNFSKPAGLRCFFKAALSWSDQGPFVEALSGQASYMVSSLLAANSWVVFPEDSDFMAVGTMVDVYPLHRGHQNV